MAWIQKRRELDKLSDLQVSYNEIEDEDDFQVIQPHTSLETDSLLLGDHNVYDFEYHDDDTLTEDYSELANTVYKISAIDLSQPSFNHKTLVPDSNATTPDEDAPVQDEVKRPNFIVKKTEPPKSLPAKNQPSVQPKLPPQPVQKLPEPIKNSVETKQPIQQQQSQIQKEKQIQQQQIQQEAIKQQQIQQAQERQIQQQLLEQAQLKQLQEIQQQQQSQQQQQEQIQQHTQQLKHQHGSQKISNPPTNVYPTAPPATDDAPLNKQQVDKSRKLPDPPVRPLNAVDSTELELLKQQLARLELQNKELANELIQVKSTIKPTAIKSQPADEFEDYFRVSSAPETDQPEEDATIVRVRDGLFSCDIANVWITKNSKGWFYNKVDEDFITGNIDRFNGFSKPNLPSLYEFSAEDLHREHLQAWCDMRMFRSLDKKCALLHSCHYSRSKNYLNSNGVRRVDNLRFPMHSDAVVAIVLSMEQSLTFREFMKCIAGEDNSVYLDAYIGYLTKLGDFEQLAKVYRYHNMSYQLFIMRMRQVMRIGHPKARSHAWENLMAEFRLKDPNNPVSDWLKRSEYHYIDYAAHILDAINLIARQIVIETHDRKVAATGKELIYVDYPRYNIIDLSIAETLKYCLFYHPYAEESKLSSPKSFAQLFRLTRHRYLYHAIITRARVRDWRAVEMLFKTALEENLCTMSSYEYLNRKTSTTGFLKSKFSGNRYSLSVLSAASFVQIISNYGGPKPLLDSIIDKCPDPDERFELARRYKCYGVAIECVTKQLKDRELALALRKELIETLGAAETQALREPLDAFLTKSERKSSSWFRKLF